MHLGRRSFILKSLSLVLSTILLRQYAIAEEEEDTLTEAESLEDSAKGSSSEFLESLPDPESLEELAIRYELRMKGDYNLSLRSVADIRLENTGRDNYRTSLKVQVPEGEGLFSILAMGLVGKRTKQYHEVRKSVSKLFTEEMHFDGRFHTRNFTVIPDRQINPEMPKQFIEFDYKTSRICSWTSHAPDSRFVRPYDGQACALTGFWNYVFFGPPKGGMQIVNIAKKRGSHVPDAEFTFEDISFEDNGNFTELVYTGRALLDLIGGKVRYKLEKDAGRMLPYLVRAGGIIDNTSLQGHFPRFKARDLRAYLSDVRV